MFEAVRKENALGKRPTLFLGSSSEGLDVAKALDECLHDIADVQVWTRAFNPGDWTLKRILELARRSDFGLFLISPDDAVKIRGNRHRAVRDNVIFEAGVFMGTLGPERTFVVLPEGGQPSLRLPSDWLGLTYVSYPPPPFVDPLALTGALEPILQRVRTLGPALRSVYSEMEVLRQSLAEHEFMLADDSTVSLMQIVTPPARRRRQLWLRGTPVRQLLSFIDEAYHDDIVDDTFWWLIVHGVVAFDNIDVWTSDGDWHWDACCDNARFTDRGLALLNEVRS